MKIKRDVNIKNDILSGTTVALALVPEAVAFSFVAGVNPQVGLQAAFMMGLITAILGGRPGMISGATGAVAVIFAPLVAKMLEMGHTAGLSAEAAMAQALGYLFAAVALMGVCQIIFGVLRLGKLIRLVPYPVMLGFVNGLAIVIFRSQFKQFTVGGELLPAVQLAIMFSLIALTMAIGIFLPKITKAVPATLVGLIVVSIIGILINHAHPGMVRTVLDFVQDGNPDVTTIAAHLPSFAIPALPFTLAAFKIIIPYSILAAAVGLIESLMTLSLIDEITETRGYSNRECIGQGIANLVNGFFGGMGGCAMIGQSMINIRGGGRGRLSGASAAILLLCFLLFLSKFIEMIPLGALVGVMFLVVIGTFEWSSLRLWRKIPHSDMLVIVIVSCVTVIADLAIAVFVGIIVSALVFAWNHGKVLSVEKKETDGEIEYSLQGPLFFGSAAYFKSLFDYKNDAGSIVINFDNAHICDHSGIEALRNIAEKYEQSGKTLKIRNMGDDCLDMLTKAGTIENLEIVKA